MIHFIHQFIYHFVNNFVAAKRTISMHTRHNDKDLKIQKPSVLWALLIEK